MDLDFDKYRLVDRSPTTVLAVVNDTPSLTENFEIDFSDYHSASRRDVRSQRVILDGNEGVKRGSIYQCSKEAKQLKKIYASAERNKIQFPQGTPSPLSFAIIDSLCSSDEDSTLEDENWASLMSLSEQSTTSVYENLVDSCSSDSMTTSESVTGPSEKDLAFDLHKSLSVNLALPHSPAISESDGSRTSSSMARFSPVKKMLDPFIKSKSQRSPLSSFNKTISGLSGISWNKTACRSLLNEEKENHISVLQCSPAHLQGLLKQGNKRGVPYFQFSMKSPEDVYVAKTWKVGNASTWVYTFHSLCQRKIRNKESNRESSVVAQMHISCHLRTESKGAGESKDFMVTEFVLYDIINSSKSTDSQDSSADVIKPSHPEMEIAAIVMQVPLEKRESLKFKSGDKKIDETPPNLLDLFQLGKATDGTFDNSGPGKMHVVIPSGNHSLPVSESCGPSPLLERWRLGGACDCGGWDMACPLEIFTNPTVKIVEGQPVIDYQNPTQLFGQGRKDNIPAFTMTLIEDGKYAVNFHAQLSALQAFSMCVAILHAADASTIVEQARSKQMVPSDSLRVFAGKEMKTMLDAIAEEEKSVVNKMKQVLPSLVLNPPFSPVARV